jgi:hypothetical protein
VQQSDPWILAPADEVTAAADFSLTLALLNPTIAPALRLPRARRS